MFTIAKPLMIAAALSGAAAPAFAAAPAAQANTAASLAVAKSVRAGAATHRDGKLAGGLGTSTITFGIIGAIIVLAAVLIATNDTPDSV